MSVASNNKPNIEINEKSLEELKEICNQKKNTIFKELTTLYSQFDENKNILAENFECDKTGQNFDYIELIEMNFDTFYHNYTKIKNQITSARQIQFYIDDVEGKEK